MKNNNKKLLIFMVVVFGVVFVSTYLGYNYINDNDEVKRNPQDMVLNKIYPIETESIYNDEEKETEEVKTENVITEDTDIQYNYKKDGEIVKTVTEKASKSLQGLTENELANTLNDATVTKFSSSIVVLDTEISENSNSYIVGNNNGYVSIYYKDKNDEITLLNQTHILIEPLPIQDKKLLEKGISAKDNVELNKIIEDYTS